MFWISEEINTRGNLKGEKKKGVEKNTGKSSNNRVWSVKRGQRN